MMLRPLNAKVKSIDGIHSQLSQLNGSVRGLQDTVEVQVKRTDSAETRIRKWRAVFQDEIQAKHIELKQALIDANTPTASPGMVTRQEIVDIIELLKQDFKKLVAEAVPSSTNVVATRQELTSIAGSLRQELQNLRNE